MCCCGGPENLGRKHLEGLRIRSRQMKLEGLPRSSEALPAWSEETRESFVVVGRSLCLVKEVEVKW
jgi:hypothetical protein